VPSNLWLQQLSCLIEPMEKSTHVLLCVGMRSADARMHE